MHSRRKFIQGSAAALALAGGSRAAAASPAPPSLPMPRKSFETFTLQFSRRNGVGASVIAADYPQILLLDSILFPFAYDLVGYDLNASFWSVEPSGTVGTSGVFIIPQQNSPQLSVSSMTGVLASVLCGLLPVATPLNPDTSPLFFEEGFAIHIPANTPISLYGCNTASAQTRQQQITAVGNLYMIRAGA